LSGTGIDHYFDTANSNNINTTPYKPRHRAEDSAGNTVTDAVNSYSQSQAETFKIVLLCIFRRLADNTMHLWAPRCSHVGWQAELVRDPTMLEIRTVTNRYAAHIRISDG
jgi:hypothetical protein